MTKAGGFIGALGRMGLVETDGEEAPVVAATPAPALHQFTPPPLIQSTTMTPAPILTPTSIAPVLDAEDQARLKALQDQVYATPSTYVIFQRVRESLGNTSDLATVFRVLSAANPGVTAAKVLADIDTHLGIVQQKRVEFDAALGNARKQQIDDPTTEIASLQTANNQATQEMAQRTARMQTLQNGIQQAQQALANGTSRFQLIEDQLSAPLIQAKRLLSTTP